MLFYGFYHLALDTNRKRLKFSSFSLITLNYNCIFHLYTVKCFSMHLWTCTPLKNLEVTQYKAE